MELRIYIVIFSIALAIIALINAISDVTDDEYTQMSKDTQMSKLDDDFDFFY